VHPAQLLLQLADLVSQSRRELEVQLRRGRVHLVGERLDQVGQLRSRERREILGVPPGVARPARTQPRDRSLAA
jgi:hypothetical protein